MNETYTNKVKQLVDDLKSISTDAGLGGEAGEYNLVTQSFLYKFLNDKFLYELNRLHPDYDVAKLQTMSDDEYTMLLDFEIGNAAAHLKPQHLIEVLYNQQNTLDFAQTFDDTLNDIAITNSDIFSVHTSGNSYIRLFEERLINDIVYDASARNEVAKRIITKLATVKFDEKIFDAGFDFFSTIFEYMIKDYNKDGGGKYAEYYTPHVVARLMSEILIGDDEPKNVRAYDPAAGSGTLLMNVASRIGTDKVTIYSQDMSQKSSNLLRLNLILNNLSHSIGNVVQGNTITESRHPEKMDYIVSNPPFKLNFSEWQPSVMSLPHASERFFAGVPNITKKAKDKMAIYLLFLQHIIYTLNDTGKAAIVVPTGFITAQYDIEMKIRQKLVDNGWLKGVVSMPSNIFATTGTNVSVIFIDKAHKGTITLVDASNLGTKIKDGKNQKTILSTDDEAHIINAFNDDVPMEDFSVKLSIADIKEKSYSLAAGQYFDVEVEVEELTIDEFEEKMVNFENELKVLFAQENTLNKKILNNLGKVTMNE